MKLLYALVRNWYFDVSIRRKLNMMNIFFFIIPIVVLALLANRISYNTILDKSINNSVQNLELINQSLIGLMNHADELGKIIVLNERIQTVIKKAIETQYIFNIEDEMFIQTVLDFIISRGESISSVVLYSKNGSVIGSGKINSNNIEKGNWSEYSKLIDNRAKTILVDMHPIAYEEGDKNCITLLKAIIDINTGKITGMAEINIKEKNISNLYSHLKYGDEGNFFIVNKEGKIVSSSSSDNIGTDVSNEEYFDWIMKNNLKGEVFSINGNKQLVTTSFFESLEWTIIGFIPLSEITVDGSKVGKVITITGLICIFLAMFFSSVISRTITLPIIRLSDTMTIAGKGDLEVRAKVKGKDEIGVLSKSFNNMITQISSLINQVYAEQKKKREFELLAIQAQINPHFLYNTLESICSLTQLGRNDDVFKMVKSLSMFYRIVLSKGRNIITIREEIDNVRHYLNIQEIRYTDKFECSFEIEEDIMDMRILKLSIQPLVENTIYHGIRNKRGKGIIQIIGRKQNDEIVISVIDNGVGIKEDVINKILLDSNEDSNKRSFGLKSVDERIKLYFGNQYGLRICSIQNVRTEIIVSLPIRKE